jgi:hypothetical protein
LRHDSRDISVSLRVIGRDPGSGVPSSDTCGRECVGFAPLATDRAQIQADATSQGGAVFVKYGPSPSFAPDSEALKVLQGMGQIDIAVMPEMVFSEEAVDELAKELSRGSLPCARLIVAGSYATTELNGSFPWNESRALNAKGATLWKQRKIWTAGIAAAQARELNIEVGAQTFVLEGTECGDTIELADIETLGRCLTLICQDVEAPQLAVDLAVFYQPDWVIMPIMDRGFVRGRWAHARAFGLSHLSQARFLAVSSLSFATELSDEVGLGFAVGPKEPSNDAEEQQDRPRAFALVPSTVVEVTPWGLLTWRDEDEEWVASSLDIAALSGGA